MMRLTLTLYDDVPIAVDGTPEECARFAAALLELLHAGASPNPSKPHPTRRQQVLRALAVLRERGNPTPRIADIVQAATELFPGANPKNLDQVVRDLANRTDTVRRLEWGRFCLSDETSA